MNIFINNKQAEITLETEKNLGQVMSGLEQWISPTGNRIHNISINGQTVPDEHLQKVFSTEIKEIERLDVSICSWRELAAEALEHLHDTCSMYEDAVFDERKNIFNDWENSYAARFFASDIPDFYRLAANTLSGEGFTAADLKNLIEERLREIVDPEKETQTCETLVKQIAARMEELPLDIQTGKDERASETIRLFSQLGEKLFRIFFVYKSAGLSSDAFTVDDQSFREFMDGFNSALRELSGAYQNQDTVLIGDTAEYELAPQLLKFFSALKNIKSHIALEL